MCLFANLPPEAVAELINAAAGTEMTIEDVMVVGERGWNLKRVINNRLGLRRENDKLPNGFLVPYEDDPSAFVPDINSMLEAYYNTRDWDFVTGFPNEGKLSTLNLDWTVEDLRQINPTIR